MCSVQKGETSLKFLDVAGGTGDISFRIIEQLEKNGAFDNMKKKQAETNEANKKDDTTSAANNNNHNGDEVKITPTALVTISDINPSMLGVGKNRAYKKFNSSTLDHIAFQEANAEKLPFADNRCGVSVCVRELLLFIIYFRF
jgi:ubiquinone/menaquinone biosynthesis C-methylase UbiE